MSVATRVFAIAALAMPFTAVPKVVPGLADDSQQPVAERVEEIESREGPNSPALIEALMSLGLSYREGGDHFFAIAAFERALGIVRFNYGLTSLDQAPLMQLLIQENEAREDVEAVWKLELELLELARRNLDDPHSAPIFREIADRRMEILRRYEAGEYLPQIVLGCYYAWGKSPVVPPDSCRSGSKQTAVRGLLLEARQYYGHAIEALVDNELFTGDELRSLESDYVRASYRLGDWLAGRASLLRLLSYDTARSESLSTRLSSLIDVADWDLLFDRRSFAFDAYRRAYDLVVRDLPEAVADIFSPTVPVVLPTFLPNDLEPLEAGGSADYVEAAFEITRYGKSRKIEILGSSEGATDDDRDWLFRTIASSQFRPQVVDGRLTRSSRVTVRYRVPER